MAAAVTDADDYRMREKLMEGLSNDGAVVANRLPQRKCSISATATTVAKERIFFAERTDGTALTLALGKNKSADNSHSTTFNRKGEDIESG